MQQRHNGGKQGSDVFAMKKEFYAGAGFDLSPDVGSLPIPKLKQASPPQNYTPAVEEVRRPISIDELLGSSPATNSATEQSRPSQTASVPLTEVDRLRLKSQQLMRILSAGGGGNQKPTDSSPTVSPSRTGDGRSISTQQLEDMTAEVRKLLNL